MSPDPLPDGGAYGEPVAPELAGDAWRFRAAAAVAGFLSLAGVLALLLGGGVAILKSEPQGWILASAGFVVFVAFFFFARWLWSLGASRLEEASRVLRTRPGRPMSLVLPGRIGLRGAVGELRDPDASVSLEPRYTVELPLPRDRFRQPEPMPVEFFLDEENPDAPVVVRFPDRAVAGIVRRQGDDPARSTTGRLFLFGGPAAILLIVLLSSAVMAPQALSLYDAVEVARASEGWPRAPGRILRSEIKKVALFRIYHSRKRGYRNVIEYEYEAGGETRTGARVRFGYEPFEDEAEAVDLDARYPPGRAVEVAYRPDKPDTAVLEPGGADRVEAEVDGILMQLAFLPAAGMALSVVLVLLARFLIRRMSGEARAGRPSGS